VRKNIEHPPSGHFFGVFSSRSLLLRLICSLPCRKKRVFVNIP
jgi:hypothetical protein